MFSSRGVCTKLGLGAAITGLIISVVLFPFANATAQTPPVRPPLTLMTSPLPLNVITKPGQSVTADLRVKNNGTQTEQIKVELLKFGASGDTGRPQLIERQAHDVYFNWVTFSENSFVAEPNVWKTIKMTIQPPKEAAFGYYFAVVFSRANPDRPINGVSGVEGGVASLVLLNVDAPGARREAKVAEITATQKVYEFLPAKFNIKLRNAGNVHVAPAGTVFIKRGSTQVAALNFNQEQGNILPGTNRIFDVNWHDGFPKYVSKEENGKSVQKLEWDYGQLQNLRFGKYTATLVAVYDDGQRDIPIEAVVSFWVIPWRILGTILLIILLVIFGTWAFMRFVWRNLRRQAETLPSAPDESSLAAAQHRMQPVQPQQAPQPAPLPPPVAPIPPVPQQPKKQKKEKKVVAPVVDQSKILSETEANEPNKKELKSKKSFVNIVKSNSAKDNFDLSSASPPRQQKAKSQKPQSQPETKPVQDKQKKAKRVRKGRKRNG